MLDYPSVFAMAAVVREGSFEAAARTLNVTASAVSQRVKALEERLGVVLVVRGQPCTATEHGRRVCRHVEQVGLLETTLRDLPGLSRHPDAARTPTLRIAVNADSLGTWFIGAAAAFLDATPTLLDLVVDDQDHTADWLRRGEVVAAVTALKAPVQGCDSVALGVLRYHATASPAFMRRHFGAGVTAAALSKAPSLSFDRKDGLSRRWAREIAGIDTDLPVHWLPSTHGFVDACLAGIGWGLNPAPLVADPLREGRLVDLVPGRWLDVPLFWQRSRIAAGRLAGLDAAVVAAGRASLVAPARSARGR